MGAEGPGAEAEAGGSLAETLVARVLAAFLSSSAFFGVVRSMSFKLETPISSSVLKIKQVRDNKTLKLW